MIDARKLISCSGFTALVGVGLLGAGEAQAQLYRRPVACDGCIANWYYFDETPRYDGAQRDWSCGGSTYDGHRGSDFSLAGGNGAIGNGHDVVAAADGVVEYAEDGHYDRCTTCDANVDGRCGSGIGGGFGNWVMLRHADGKATIYAHMRQGSVAVSRGQQVGCGQVVGQIGSSGCTTGAHLHFEVRPAGATSSNNAQDPFEGACSPTSPPLWVEQGGHRGLPGATCACAAGQEACNGADDDCDGVADEDDVCEIEELHHNRGIYAPDRSTDIDGDGLADACGRGIAGLWCHMAQGSGFADRTAPIPWSDGEGWGGASHASTIRMGDVTGDGRADACARAAAGWICAPSLGDGFGAIFAGPALSDANGWGHPRFYSTIRLADIDGDGRDDVCARDGEGLICWRSRGEGFEEAAIRGPAWSDASGFGWARFYGTLRMPDVNGDGLDDACIRSSFGIECWLSDGQGFPTGVQGPAWSDDNGWGALPYWSTIRFADLNADGMDDVCARAGAGLRCHLSLGDGFGEAIAVDDLSDASGWNDPANFGTLRAGDVTGDGGAELCARGDGGVLCYTLQGGALTRIDGPAWSDADGWGAAQHWRTLQLADVTGDGRFDLCARAAAGLVCAPAVEGGFGGTFGLAEFTNEGGWADPTYYPSVRVATPPCRPHDELCNSGDDDCDGQIDEGRVCASDPNNTGGPNNSGAPNNADPANNGGPNSGGSGNNAAGPNNADPANNTGAPNNADPDDDPTTHDNSVITAEGCATAAPRRSAALAPLLGLLAALALLRRRR